MSQTVEKVSLLIATSLLKHEVSAHAVSELGALKMQDRKMEDLKMEDLLGMRRAFVVRGTEAGEHRADMSKHAPCCEPQRHARSAAADSRRQLR